MTWEDVNSNLSKRATASLKSLVTKSDDAPILILNSANDAGVIRNGGRRGAAHGPKALCANFLKLAKRNYKKSINIEDICSPLSQTEDFEAFQREQSQKIGSTLNGNRDIVIHFGGGHDHAFPFVDAIIKEYGAVSVINLDAHLDTRDDALSHSGTPFRQLMNIHGEKLQLIQVGIHDYANVCENYQKLDMTVHTVNEIKAQTNNFANSEGYIKSVFDLIPQGNIIILSLDMDAIDGPEMPAVSAVNHDGLPMNFIRQFYNEYKKSTDKHFLGVYEYNPLFDNLGCASARAMASTLYNFLV
jgi:formiminoglutamase